MGLSASQARFLQLTARRSDIEYEAQQINFERLQLSEKLADASTKYQDAMYNRKLTFQFNNGQGIQSIDLSYTNYKNFLNQQNGQTNIALDKYYLVSSSGNKFVVSSEKERDEMIEKSKTRIPISDIQAAKERYAQAEANGTVDDLSAQDIRYNNIDLTVSYNTETEVVDDKEIEYYVEYKYTENDFLIDENITDVSAFQRGIQNGTYYFAKYAEDSQTHEQVLKRESWDMLGGGAISETFDKSDDAQAQAEYDRIQATVQQQDKKLELKLDQLETNRNAIQTEIDSVKKVLEDNIEKTFNTFS